MKDFLMAMLEDLYLKETIVNRDCKDSLIQDWEETGGGVGGWRVLFLLLITTTVSL